MKYYFSCPECGSDKEFVTPNEDTDGLGCALLVFGGLLPALIWADHSHRRVQCAHCSLIFRQPRHPGTPVARLAAYVIVLVLVLAFVTAIFFATAKPASSLPSLPIIASIEEAVATQPRTTAYLLTVLAVLLILPCWIIACISNIRYRRELSRTYHMRPMNWDERRRQQREEAKATKEAA